MFGEDMIYEYFQDEKTEFEQNRERIKNKIQTLKIDVKEINQFIQILDKQIDPEREAFTPLDIDKETRKKIRELEGNLKEKQNLLEELENKLIRLDDRIASLNSLIERAKILEEESHQGLENEKNGLEDLNHKGFRLKLLETQEAERKRIARDLHDSTVQELTALTHKLEFCARLIDTDPLRSKLELMKTSQNTRETINDMRKIIYDLRPMSLDDMGLGVTLEREMARLEKESGVHIDLRLKQVTKKYPSIINLTLYRIVREASINAIKHANASNIQINFIESDENVKVSITDDGKGFDPEVKENTSEQRRCFGLATMKERIYLLSGTLNIKSKMGQGTTIFVSIPVASEVEHD